MNAVWRMKQVKRAPQEMEYAAFLEFRTTGEMILDRNVHFGYMKKPFIMSA